MLKAHTACGVLTATLKPRQAADRFVSSLDNHFVHMNAALGSHGQYNLACNESALWHASLNATA